MYKCHRNLLVYSHSHFLFSSSSSFVSMLFTNSSSHCVQWKCLQKQHTTELQFHYLDIVRKNDGKKNLLMKVERRNENGNNIKKTSSELMWTMTYNNSMEFILCRKMKWHQKKTRNSEWLKKYTEQASERRKKENYGMWGFVYARYEM